MVQVKIGYDKFSCSNAKAKIKNEINKYKKKIKNNNNKTGYSVFKVCFIEYSYMVSQTRHITALK